MPTLESTRIVNRRQILPNMTNNLGTVHGGVIMHMMDATGALSAMRFAGKRVVTAHVDDIDFIHPIPGGDIARVDSYVYEAGRSSISVRIRVYGEDPLSGDGELTSASRFTYVALDDDRRPTDVPSLQVESDEARRLRTEALED